MSALEYILELDKKLMLVSSRVGAIEEVLLRKYPDIKHELDQIFMSDFEEALKVAKTRWAYEGADKAAAKQTASEGK